MLIKLKQPLNYKGAFCKAETVLPVDTEFGKKLVDSGAAEYMPTAAEEQAKEAQRIAGEKTDEVQQLEQALREAVDYIKTLEDALHEEREQSAKKISELGKALAEAEKQLAEAENKLSEGHVSGDPAAGTAETKQPKKGDK